MCTSVYIETKDAHHLTARVMDFHIPLDIQPIFIPRGYSWPSVVEKETQSTKFCFVGTGRKLGGTYFVADGINEKGLSISELYLPQEAKYQKQAIPGKVNLSPDAFILYALGNVSTIDELSTLLETVNLVESPLPQLNIITPLHWIITDQTGRCVIIEPLGETLTIRENPVGVLTNSPDFDWQVQNLRNYLHVRPEQCPSTAFGSYTATPFSQGTGTQGLAGGFTPPERFVRAAFFREYIEQANTEEEGIHTLLKILGAVSVPKGLVLNPEKLSDYSQYMCMMCNESLSYYHQDYSSNVITKLVLNEDLMKNTTVQLFDAEKTILIKALN